MSTISTYSQDSSFAGLQDTTYFKSYEGFLTGRIFIGNRYSNLDIIPSNNQPNSISFKPNTPITLGIGATYQWLTVNVGTSFNFLNQHREDRGETKFIDLQSHLYGRRSIIDFNAHFYRGFFQETTYPNAEKYYLRPDIRIMQLGFNFERVLNWRRFSFRAAMLQSERQFKSAGSPLIGLAAHYVVASADSSFIPYHSIYNGFQDLSRLRNLDIGPSVGYAYTLVLAKRVFIMGGLTGQLNINFAQGTFEDGDRTEVSIKPNLMTRAAIGYQRPLWTIAATWVNQNITTQVSPYDFNLRSGHVRASIAYRFRPSAKVKRMLRPIEVLDEKVIRKITAKFVAKPPKK